MVVGLGAAGVTGGMIFGSGAFSTVDADRDVEVTIATDRENEGLISIFGRFVQYDSTGEDDGIAAFAIDDGTFDADGLNPDAQTTFEATESEAPLSIRIEAGSQGPYRLTVSDEDDLSANGLEFAVNESQSDIDAGDIDDNDPYPLVIENIGPGDEIAFDFTVESGENDANETLGGELGLDIQSQ